MLVSAGYRLFLAFCKKGNHFLLVFMDEELNDVLKKIKNRKAVGLDEILPEVWKT